MSSKRSGGEAMRQCEAPVVELAGKAESWPFVAPVSRKDVSSLLHILAEVLSYQQNCHIVLVDIND